MRRFVLLLPVLVAAVILSVSSPVLSPVITEVADIPAEQPDHTAEPDISGRQSLEATAGPVVYLTIDGGPSAAFSEKVLPVLAAHQCIVTWFVVGEHLVKEPDAAAVIAQAGHELAIHTWTHPELTRLTDERIRMELELTFDTILEQTGQRPRFVRPPYGDHNARVDGIIRELGYEVAMWDIDYPDFLPGTPGELVERICSGVRSGSIVLLHVTRLTWQALPMLLKRLDAMGYRYAPLSAKHPELTVRRKNGPSIPEARFAGR